MAARSQTDLENNWRLEMSKVQILQKVHGSYNLKMDSVIISVILMEAEKVGKPGKGWGRRLVVS